MNKAVLIAKVASAHGIKGEVNILFFGDNPKNLEKYQLFDLENNFYKLKLLNKNNLNNNSNKVLIAKIWQISQETEGDKELSEKLINDRNQAELLKDLELYVKREEFSKTKKNEFYIIDLIGLDVVNNNQQKIGKVLNVYDFGSVPNIEIEFLEDHIPQGFQKIDNFPFKNDFFPEIDLEKCLIQFEAPQLK